MLALNSVYTFLISLQRHKGTKNFKDLFD